MNRNRFKGEERAENISKLKATLISFAITIGWILVFLFILYAPTNKKIMAPIEEIQAQFKAV